MQDHHAYNQGYSDGASSKDDNNNLASYFFIIVLAVLNYLILFSPAILLTYFIFEKLRWFTTGLSRWPYFWLYIAVVYIVECAVFFLKGWLISLRIQKHKLWLVMLVLLSLYCFILPTLFFQTLISGTFISPANRAGANGNIVVWVVSGLIGLYVYYRYSLTKASCPKFFLWSYRLGYKL